MRVIDTAGNEAEAIYLDGPTMLGVEGGDVCVEAGMWAIYYPGIKPIPITQEQYDSTYRSIE